MTAVSRTAQFAKVHKVLKKYYKPRAANAGRTVIEHLLFACCLEDAHHDAAEEAFAALVHTFFDWNEVRVTSISELSEVMACLPDPRAAANRIKRVLHAVFEATFNFDLEDRRKKNLGPTVKWLEKLDGTTPFHGGLRGPSGPGRTRHPHRRRHHGRAPRARPGDRQRRRRGRGAGAGAGRGQVKGRRVRLPAPRTGRRLFGQSLRAAASGNSPARSARTARAGCPSGGSRREPPAQRR